MTKHLVIEKSILPRYIIIHTFYIFICLMMLNAQSENMDSSSNIRSCTASKSGILTLVRHWLWSLGAHSKDQMDSWWLASGGWGEGELHLEALLCYHSLIVTTTFCHWFYCVENSFKSLSLVHFYLHKLSGELEFITIQKDNVKVICHPDSFAMINSKKEQAWRDRNTWKSK